MCHRFAEWRELAYLQTAVWSGMSFFRDYIAHVSAFSMYVGVQLTVPARGTVPFVMLMLALLLLVTYVPVIST